jgi:Rrf2 family protein
MAVNTQFSIALHMMATLGVGCEREGEMTSSELADSVNAAPSFVRRVLSKLSKAGLVQTRTGKTGACSLAKKAKDISLLEIYEAVEAPKAFAIHSYPNQKTCRVSCNIKTAMEKVLNRTQKSMEQSLSKLTLAELVEDLKKN